MIAEAIAQEDALRFTRVVETNERLSGGVMKPMAGSTRVQFERLAQVEAFLRPTTAEELTALGTNAEIHYVDLRVLASWVRDTIGDVELAARLEAVVDTEQPYGLLVPDIKRAIAERLAEYEAALSPE